MKYGTFPSTDGDANGGILPSLLVDSGMYLDGIAGDVTGTIIV